MYTDWRSDFFSIMIHDHICHINFIIYQCIWYIVFKWSFCGSSKANCHIEITLSICLPVHLWQSRFVFAGATCIPRNTGFFEFLMSHLIGIVCSKESLRALIFTGYKTYQKICQGLEKLLHGEKVLIKYLDGPLARLKLYTTTSKTYFVIFSWIIFRLLYFWILEKSGYLWPLLGRQTEYQNTPLSEDPV